MIFERLKELYKSGAIKSLSIYVAKGLITPEQAEEIVNSAK